MSCVSSYKSNGSLVSINLVFYPDVSGAGSLVKVMEPSDTVTLCEFVVTWSAQIAIHNVSFIQLMSHDKSVKTRLVL